MNVLVAMSGGVDSSLAAALALEQGHDVTGVHLKLADLPVEEQVPGQGCCTLDDAQDARRVAQVLDIPFYVWDLSAVFAREVQVPFAADYADGRTPNPCIACNRSVKYSALLARARALGFDALATGHYLRVRRRAEGWELLRAVDAAKDQSYVLYMASQDQLAHSLFPVGELTKARVRDEARRRGLRVAHKPDSFDICFVTAGTRTYLEQRLPSVPGPIVDLHGEVLGTHEGIWRYTIGQRRGLGLGSHERHFVVDLDRERNTVVVGPREALGCGWVELDEVSWVNGAPAGGRVRAQLRAHGTPVPAEARSAGGRWRVEFGAPVHGLAEGQACVLYTDAPLDEQRCLGGGTVVAAQRPVRAAS